MIYSTSTITDFYKQIHDVFITNPKFISNLSVNGDNLDFKGYKKLYISSSAAYSVRSDKYDSSRFINIDGNDFYLWLEVNYPNTYAQSLIKFVDAFKNTTLWNDYRIYHEANTTGGLKYVDIYSTDTEIEIPLTDSSCNLTNLYFGNGKDTRIFIPTGINLNRFNKSSDNPVDINIKKDDFKDYLNSINQLLPRKLQFKGNNYKLLTKNNFLSLRKVMVDGYWDSDDSKKLEFKVTNCKAKSSSKNYFSIEKPEYSYKINDFNISGCNFDILDYFVGDKTTIVLKPSDEYSWNLTVKYKTLDIKKKDTKQIIYYGTPGSGKSHEVSRIEQSPNNICFRTTFHPDFDYASFVGSYKPTLNNSCQKLTVKQLAKKLKDYASYYSTSIFEEKFAEDYSQDICVQDINDLNTKYSALGLSYTPNFQFIHDKAVCYSLNKKITYSFEPQIFTKAYIAAWNELVKKDSSKDVYLIIEEINRGNCAQIFGDLFQLLDRDEDGFSTYPINPNTDLLHYLEENLDSGNSRIFGLQEGKIWLPSNLHIVATMNTSDQSLFPMDSAFKRRWDWQYVPVNYKKADASFDFTITINKGTAPNTTTEYKWIKFLEQVNKKIKNLTKSEDKQMGNFFIKGSVSQEEFINKVMFYLWNDVAKEYYGTKDCLLRLKESIKLHAGDKDEDKTDSFTFNDLFYDEKESAEILTGFFDWLEVPKA